MEDASIMGRLRPLVRQCRDQACPCPPGSCQLDVAIADYEADWGDLPPTLQLLREEVSRRLEEVEAACEADTDPAFFENYPGNKRSEPRFPVCNLPVRLQRECGDQVDAKMIDSSFKGAGLSVPQDVTQTFSIGDRIRVYRCKSWQLAEVRGVLPVGDDETRLSIAWIGG